MSGLQQSTAVEPAEDLGRTQNLNHRHMGRAS